MEGANIRSIVEVAGIVDRIDDPNEWSEYYSMLVQNKTDYDTLWNIKFILSWFLAIFIS